MCLRIHPPSLLGPRPLHAMKDGVLVVSVEFEVGFFKVMSGLMRRLRDSVVDRAILSFATSKDIVFSTQACSSNFVTYLEAWDHTLFEVKKARRASRTKPTRVVCPPVRAHSISTRRSSLVRSSFRIDNEMEMNSGFGISSFNESKPILS